MEGGTELVAEKLTAEILAKALHDGDPWRITRNFIAVKDLTQNKEMTAILRAVGIPQTPTLNLGGVEYDLSNWDTEYSPTGLGRSFVSLMDDGKEDAGGSHVLSVRRVITPEERAEFLRGTEEGLKLTNLGRVLVVFTKECDCCHQGYVADLDEPIHELEGGAIRGGDDGGSEPKAYKPKKSDNEPVWIGPLVKF